MNNKKNLLLGVIVLFLQFTWKVPGERGEGIHSTTGESLKIKHYFF